MITNAVFTKAELARLAYKIGLPEFTKLQEATRHQFAVESDGQRILLGGVCTDGMLSDVSYFWFILLRKKFASAEIRRGIFLARRYLKNYPGTKYCEVAHGDIAGDKFARVCGFTPKVKLDDRTVYKWSATWQC